MIGVETIFVFQLIFISLTFLREFDDNILLLQVLQFPFGKINFSSETNDYFMKNNENDVNDNFFVVACIEISLVQLIILLQIIKKIFKTIKRTTFIKLYKFLLKFSNFIYSFICFSVFIGFATNLIITMMNKNP
jgi:hypothetical protein